MDYKLTFKRLFLENQTLVHSIESELDKPKENMQPVRRQVEHKETPRTKRERKTASLLNTQKEIVTNNKISQQQLKPRVHANVYPADGQYITTCAPNATIPSQELCQTAPLSTPSRQFVHTTSLSAPVNAPYSPMQSRASPHPLPMSDLEPVRDLPANVPEMNTFQGDFITAIDKAFFSSKITLNLDDYVGASWVQNETPNLTVLNTVNIQENNPMHGNGTMNFPGNGNYPVSYDSNAHPSVYSNSQSTLTNPRPQEIPYVSPNKEDFGYVQTLTNVYPRYNAPNYLYDPMRNVVQPGGSDVMAFNGLLNAPVSSYGMDGMASHDVQLNRLGVGAV